MTSSLAAPGQTRIATVEEIRAQFPALARQHRGRAVAYFDGPGGTQVPRAVSDAVTDYLLNHNANTHWRYPSSRETDAMLEAARGALADLLGALGSEIAFGANMTTLTFHLARGLGRAWGPGDEIVVTELDHHANVAPWQALARERGVTLRMVPMVLESGQLDWAALEGALSGRTRLLAIGAASNALGTVSDVARAVALAQGAGALTFVDAVHYGRPELVAGLEIPKLAPAPDTPPERIETGTLNHEGIVGAGAAVDFLAGLAGSQGTRRERLRAVYGELDRRGLALVQRLLDGLRAIDGVRVYGPPAAAARTPTVAFTVEGRDPDDVADALAEAAVFASTGDFYATTVVRRYGLEVRGGLVRAGCAAYTTADEVDRLLEVVARVARAG